ncbi:hypothetical protein ACFVHB_34360 [Kitasatospora sp. NPDC127111]|uniref:hypothetical protein n=1 Tax=Kitasatospora sp. NPDC127111 TaxID=3345363 RepID=UPI003628BF5F
MRKTARIAIAGALTGAALLGVAGNAAASNTYIKGAYAYYDPNKHMFGLGDTEPDGNSVFIEWWADGVKQGRITNSRGNGKWKDVVIDSGLWGQPLRWRVCVDISWDLDRCSGYMQETA